MNLIIQNTFEAPNHNNNVAIIPVGFQFYDNPDVTPNVVRRDLVITRPPPPALEDIDRTIWNPNMLPF